MSQKDPVCGMMVETDDAIVADHGSHRHYFCSTACRDQFQADPGRYEGSHASHGDSASGMEQHEPPRTQAAGFTAPKFGSAGSGGAEFEPIPEQHDHDEDQKR